MTVRLLLLALTLALFPGAAPPPAAGQSQPPALPPAEPANACSAISLGENGKLNGFVPAPDSPWHLDVTKSTAWPDSPRLMTTPNDLNNAGLHGDFTSAAYGSYGMSYVVVDSATTPMVPIKIGLYANDSDVTFAPIPDNAPIEGTAPGACNKEPRDRHLIVIDRRQCVAYEFWQTEHCDGHWSANASALWDLTKNEVRPYGMTSADAAGLSIFEGIVRYEEIEAGEIDHAIRFTALHTRRSHGGGYFIWPATHGAGTNSASDNIMGMRLRLKASFDISHFSRTNQIILRAMKKYGIILADNGTNMFFQGAPDDRWDDDDLHRLRAVRASSFELVPMGKIYDSESYPSGHGPRIRSFTASAESVHAGTPVTLTAETEGASYSFIDGVGIVRGSVVVRPTATTTYKLVSRNQFGTATKSVRVRVE